MLRFRTFPMLVIVLLTLGACKQVITDDLVQEEQRFCQTTGDRIGHWQSDSIHIQTTVDTIDSVIVNTRPTYFYDLQVNCGEDSLFWLRYVNFSGVVTQDVESFNYVAGNEGYYIFSPLEATPDTASADFILRVVDTSDSTMQAHYIERPNSGQRTRYDIYFRRVD